MFSLKHLSLLSLIKINFQQFVLKIQSFRAPETDEVPIFASQAPSVPATADYEILYLDPKNVQKWQLRNVIFASKQAQALGAKVTLIQNETQWYNDEKA